MKKKEKQSRQLELLLFTIYNRRQVRVTIKKYNVYKPPYIQIRLFTAKEIEAIKQVTYVNYFWTNSKNFPKFWETSCLLRTVMYIKLCYFCFLSCNLTIYPQNHFSLGIGVKQYELEFWFFRKFNFKTSPKIGIFSYCSRKKVPKNFTNNYKISKLTKLAEIGCRFANILF